MDTDMTILLYTKHEDLPTEVKQRVLEEARHYLNLVNTTHTLPGIGMVVRNDESLWCGEHRGIVHASMSAIWYMGRTQRLFVLEELGDYYQLVGGILGYLNSTAWGDGT
jgi:hypothetical protein